MPHLNPVGTMFALLPAVLMPSLSSAQDEDVFDRTPVECISVSAIDRTDVVDDRTILFYMRGKKVYRNYLPRKCPGLEREERFSYRPTSNRLCQIDTVTVLELWSGRLSAGFTCPLGEFHPIPPEEVEELTRDPAEGGAFEVEEVELPEDEAEATDEPDPEAETSDESPDD